MNFRKWMCTSVFAFAATFMAAHSASAASGSYHSSTMTPTIYTWNVWHNAAYPVMGNIPANARVTMVFYAWDYSYPRPNGVHVHLCNNAGTLCADVSNNASGYVNFSGQNIPANQPLRLFARVVGSGTMTPLYSRPTSVTVNYTY